MLTYRMAKIVEGWERQVNQAEMALVELKMTRFAFVKLGDTLRDQKLLDRLSFVELLQERANRLRPLITEARLLA